MLCLVGGTGEDRIERLSSSDFSHAQQWHLLKRLAVQFLRVGWVRRSFRRVRSALCGGPGSGVAGRNLGMGRFSPYWLSLVGRLLPPFLLALLTIKVTG